jgi:hypothetical protein
MKFMKEFRSPALYRYFYEKFTKGTEDTTLNGVILRHEIINLAKLLENDRDSLHKAETIQPRQGGKATFFRVPMNRL